MKKNFRDLLRSGDKVVGTILQFYCPEAIEILAFSGYDYVVIDNEHSPATYEQTLNMIRTADSVGLACLIRVPEISEDAIKKAFDMGCSGIKVPTVSNLEEAKLVVEYAKFAPLGKRGACPFVRANRYACRENNKVFYKEENANTVLSLNIEGPEGVKNVEQIIRLDGVDAVSVGRMDLSVALGIPGEVEHPSVKQAVKDVARIAHECGKYAGVFLDRAEDAAEFKDSPGVNHFLTTIPEEILYAGYKKMREDIRKYC